MISDILYRCPACGAFDWLEQDVCRHCGVTIEVLARTHVAIGGVRQPLGYWYDKVLGFRLPDSGGSAILTSKKVRLSREQATGEYRGFAGMHATHYEREVLDEGTLCLHPDRLVFSGMQGSRTLEVAALVSMTIESDTLIVVSKGEVPLFFDFLEESGKKWEDCLRQVIANHHQAEVLEYCPRIRLKIGSFLTRPRPVKGHVRLRVPVHRTFAKETSLVFSFLKNLTRLLFTLFIPMRIEGLENIPSSGPAIVAPNHCSFLDSLLVGSFSKRPIWFMGKNSEFKNPLKRWGITRGGTFPVRRYTTDVAAVRNAIRIVQEGNVLGIFPEGERCWDNRLLPFKLGTMRLILALGKPVIPVGFSGAYALMPRWTSSIERVPVTIRVGKPLFLGHIPIAAQTLDDLKAADAKLRAALQSLIEEQP